LSVFFNNVHTNCDFKKRHPNSRSIQSSPTKFLPLLLKSYPESFSNKSKKIPKKPEKAQIFVWNTIEGFNLDPRLLTGTLSKL
jgi:hypothetical protein